MEKIPEEDRLIRNLKDAGRDETTIKKYLWLQKESRRQDQYRLLSMQRAFLLDQVHVNQYMIDCLDYLVYSMKKAQV